MILVEYWYFLPQLWALIFYRPIDFRPTEVLTAAVKAISPRGSYGYKATDFQ